MNKKLLYVTGLVLCLAAAFIGALLLMTLCMWGCSYTWHYWVSQILFWGGALGSLLFVLVVTQNYFNLTSLSYKKPKVTENIKDYQDIKIQDNGPKFGFLLTIIALILNPIVIAFGLIGLLGGQFFIALLIIPSVFYFVGKRSLPINFIGLIANAILLVIAIYQSYLYSAYINEYITGFYLIGASVLATTAICNLLALWPNKNLITR